MYTHFKTETAVAQNLIDDIFFNFDCQRIFPQEGFQVKKISGYGVNLLKNEALYAELDKRAKAVISPVVILQQAIFYDLFILCLWLKIIRRSDQSVYFMNFSSHIFFNDINHGYRAAVLQKNYLWLLPLYMAVATYFYYETAIVLYLLNCCNSEN